MQWLPCRIRLADPDSVVRVRLHKNTGKQQVAGRRQRQGRSVGSHLTVCLRPAYCRETHQSSALALLFSFADEESMTTASEFRAIAMSLPESTEAPHFDRAAFKVKRIYATLAADGM